MRVFRTDMFRNRQEAGQLLARKFKKLKGQKVVVLGLARGGVVVAKEIANVLNAPLDALVVKKIGSSGNEELALGAVGPERIVIWDEDLCQRVGADEDYKEKALAIKSQEREEKEQFLRQGRKPLDLFKKTVILVDDGIATGATALAAVAWVKSQNPEKIILAVPVAPPDTLEKLRPQVDYLVCLKVEIEFWAVGQFYKEFPQVSDEEVVKLLL